jgi:hypothetical protein
MKRRSCATLAAVALIAGSLPAGAEAASPPRQILPRERDIWITGTIQQGKYTPGDYATILLVRPSTSPCNDQVVRDILLGKKGAPDPTLLLPYLNQRVAVRGRILCPDSGTQFTPQPDVVFPIY